MVNHEYWRAVGCAFASRVGLSECRSQCIRSLEEWVEGVRGDSATGAVDGTVHQLAAAALAHCHALAAHMHTIGTTTPLFPTYGHYTTQHPSTRSCSLAHYWRSGDTTRLCYHNP